MPFRFVLLFFAALNLIPVFAQKKKVTAPTPAPDFEKIFSPMKYRCIGPTRGGRSTAVAGIPGQQNTFFMGTTGGGVWRTDDAGLNWNNITDGQISVGSIGAIRVAPSDPNVIYVGTGSADPRGNVSPGRGIYRSTDGGKTWAFAGLEKAGQIGRLVIHPENPDIVFAAVLGNVFGQSAERGVYRSNDGGRTWSKVLYVNEKTGAMDLVMDPKNPRILYAGMWQFQRKPWTVIDGGADGGVYRSKDGGDTWSRITGGLPDGVLGKIGIAISPVKPDRIWVLVETPEDAKGGLFRSDDGGNSFQRINGDRELRTRHWYYTHIFADPKDAETVYVNNVNFLKSLDGGLNFKPIRVLHGDCHDLWINPDFPEVMIHSNDGGAHITTNGGKSWSTQNNQPTAEFYRVEVDNNFPYRVYGCQQDNSSISVSSAGRGRQASDWLMWGGESGHVAVDPRDGTIYSGNYTGELYRYDVKRDHVRTVTHYPQLHDGLPLYHVKYRYQWNAPITISTHQPDVLYHCSQYVHKTIDGGQTWEVISPDLTLNRKEHQELPGGPVQIDNTGVENFNTIFVLEESPVDAAELWAGTDDGLVHVTRDGGKSWKKITPPGLPELATVNSIDISTVRKGRAYVTAHNYRLNDYRPYIFRTDDYGVTWTSLTKGIPEDHFVRVVREDPAREGLLYCGTEYGMFLSIDGGQQWSSFQLNMPRTPITDLVVHRNDLVISTQGRSFWILDDLTPLQQWSADDGNKVAHIYKPRVAYRTQSRSYGSGIPEPAPSGASVSYQLQQAPDSAHVVRIEITDASGSVRKKFSSAPGKDEEGINPVTGLNRLSWNLSLPAPEITPGTVLGYGWPSGPKAPSGNYTITLRVGDLTEKQSLQVLADPKWSATDEDLRAQYDLSVLATEGINSIHKTIRRIRDIRTQANAISERSGSATIKSAASQLVAKLTTLEEELTQTKSKAGQDPINYPPRFDEQWNWLCQVVGQQDARPNQGCYDLHKDLRQQLVVFMARMQSIVDQDVSAFNKMVSAEQKTGILLPDAN